jgi:hypothetical protein
MWDHRHTVMIRRLFGKTHTPNCTMPTKTALLLAAHQQGIS